MMAPHLICAKSCRISAAVPYEVARKRVKAWLIVGNDIACDLRPGHMASPVSLAARDPLPGLTEAELDRQAEDIMAARPADGGCWRCVGACLRR